MQLVFDVDALNAPISKMQDMTFLLQDIHEEYFEKYDSSDAESRTAVAWEYDRYAAFFRMVMVCFDDVMCMLDTIKAEAKARKKLSSHK